MELAVGRPRMTSAGCDGGTVSGRRRHPSLAADRVVAPTPPSAGRVLATFSASAQSDATRIVKLTARIKYRGAIVLHITRSAIASPTASSGTGQPARAAEFR